MKMTTEKEVTAMCESCLTLRPCLLVKGWWLCAICQRREIGAEA